MKFDATTAQGVNPAFTFGECRFQVESAHEKKSKGGQPMIELQLSLLDKGNVQASAFEYLMPSATWKIKAFCDSVGVPFDIKNKDSELEAYMCQSKIGECITEPGEYNGEKKVTVKKFMPLTKSQQAKQNSMEMQAPVIDDGALPFTDDEIPFG